MVKQLGTSSEIETGCSVKSFDFHRCQVGCHPDRLAPSKSSKPVQIKIHLTSHFLRGEQGGWKEKRDSCPSVALLEMAEQ